jgi:hypothetical protein
VRGLSDAQLDTPYRSGGWTVRQVVHHVPDSHLNAYIRVKLALTENVPTIKPYDEAAWANLEDSRTTPIETSLTMFDSVTDRWMRVLRAMSPADFARTLNHPENGIMTFGRCGGDVRLAHQTPRRAHHRIERAQRLVIDRSTRAPACRRQRASASSPIRQARNHQVVERRLTDF